MKEPQNNFDPIAPYYDRLAYLVFGEAITKSQTFFLKHISRKAHILVMGGGTGWWLNQLLRDNPDCTIVFIDASKKMLERAQKNSSDRVKFIYGTEEDISPIKFDAIITFFFLDLFAEDDLKRVVGRLKTYLMKDGIWLISDFVNHKWWHRVFLFLMYRFFRFIGALKTSTLANWEKEMMDQGLHRKEEIYFCGNFITSRIYKNL